MSRLEQVLLCWCVINSIITLWMLSFHNKTLDTHNKALSLLLREDE